MTNDTLPLPTRTVEVRIGWTKNTDETRAEGYVSFHDGYQPGREQVTLDLVLQNVSVDMTPEHIAEAAFIATNAPFVGDPFGLPAVIADMIGDAGYHGEDAHYSLSVGDTVTVGEVMLACASLGWERIR